MFGKETDSLKDFKQGPYSLSQLNLPKLLWLVVCLKPEIQSSVALLFMSGRVLWMLYQAGGYLAKKGGTTPALWTLNKDQRHSRYIPKVEIWYWKALAAYYLILAKRLQQPGLRGCKKISRIKWRFDRLSSSNLWLNLMAADINIYQRTYSDDWLI